MPRPRPRSLLATMLLGVLALSGCTSTVSLDPAPQANDPLCAEITAYLPDSVAGEPRRWTDAQATGAWGDPASIILTCGLTPPGPSELPCQEAGGVDWLVDASEAPLYRYTTFGRTPAVQVFLDNQVVSSRDVLDTLSVLVSRLPRDRECTERHTGS